MSTDASYADEDFANVNVPAARAPAPKSPAAADRKDLGVDTSLTGGGGAVNDELSTTNPALEPTISFPMVSRTAFDALNLPASGISLRHAAKPTAVKKSPTPGVSNVRSSVVRYAKKFLGVPYVWGGTSPRGFDCSGLVQYVLRANGKTMPRVSYQQARVGRRAKLSALRPGDLIAWDHGGRTGADHIAIYIGGGRIIEAPHTGARVRIRKLRKRERYWGVRLTYPGE